MKIRWTTCCALLLAALLLAVLCGCGALGFLNDEARQEAAATEAPSRIPDNAVTLDLRGAALTQEEIVKIMQTRTLTSLDIRDNDISKETYIQLSGALPNCKILWSVPLGAQRVDSDSTALTLDSATDAASLFEALRFLPALSEADLTASSIGTDELLLLMEAYPAVAFHARVSVCGAEADSAATALDLSQAAAFDAGELLSALRLFPALESVNLAGRTLSFDEMDQLVTAYPDVHFLWSFTFMDVPCTSEDTFLDLSGKTMTGTDEVKRILRYLPALTALDMCDCGLSNEQMGALREQFPNIAIHWRITVGRWTMRTDVTAFSTGKDRDSTQVKYDRKAGKAYLSTEDIAPLQYCTEMIALDIGHQKIDDISVVANMKKLRFLIIADGKFTDITPIASCTELEFLEVFQNYIADFSPLLSLTKLKCLNCGATKSPDKAGEEAAALERLNVLKQMPQLERLWCIHAGFDSAQIDELQAALPDCQICSGGAHPTAGGWRTGNELYREMQGLFELKVLN